MQVLFVKSHIKGYVRKDGVVVKDHENKVQKQAQPFKLSAAKQAVCKEAEKAGFKVFTSSDFIRVFRLKEGGKLDRGIVIYPSGKAVKFGESHAMAMESSGQWREALGLSQVDKPAVGGAPKPYQSSFFAPKPKPEPAAYHPKQNDSGKRVGILTPSKPTDLGNFSDPAKIATVVPGGEVPAELNGVPFAPWADAPTDLFDWANVDGQIELDEPEMPQEDNKHVSAGVIVQEPDGRVWVIHPTNEFGGYKGTFPKGTVEDGLSLQASAIKEAYEESGLKCEITGYFGDVSRSTSVARYYLAKRVGGSPADCGWESQAVSLVPVKDLYGVLNRSVDHGTAEKLGAGPAPVPPSPPKPSFGSGLLW